ncbi:MAG: class I SAM-dependent methyltransferase [Bryobacteraceae bacterium]
MNPGPIVDLIDAFRRSKVLFVATSFGIFDRLQSATATCAELATELPADPDALERLLDACVGLGLLAKHGSIYTNTPLASVYLWRESPQTLSGYIRYSESALYPLWANLASAVKEGGHQWKRTFGAEGSSLFDHFFNTEESKRDFLAGMNGFGMLSSPSVVAAFDLSRFQRLVDLGGATGHLPIAACELYPHLRGVVFDLPVVVPVAREYIAKSKAADRVDVMAGDFFSGDLPDSDLFALGRILHDWAEPKIHLLLRKIYDKLPPGGALLLAEKLLADDKSGPTPVHTQSLNMLICTEGKERTLPEYSQLLKRAGFASVEGKVTGKPVDAVLAVK